MLGFGIGWRWEGWAALLILAGSGLFHAVERFQGHITPIGPFHLPIFVGLLYALCWRMQWRYNGNRPMPRAAGDSSANASNTGKHTARGAPALGQWIEMGAKNRGKDVAISLLKTVGLHLAVLIVAFVVFVLVVSNQVRVFKDLRATLPDIAIFAIKVMYFVRSFWPVLVFLFLVFDTIICWLLDILGSRRLRRWWSVGVIVAVALFVGVLLLSVAIPANLASNSSTTAGNGPVVNIVAQPNGPWIARLPGGGTVELVGVGEKARWWRPDGSPLAEPPYVPTGAIHGSEKDVSRYFFARVNNLPSRPAGMTCDITPCTSTGVFGDVIQHGRHVRNRGDFFAFDSAVPATQRTATVRCGISSGPWEDVAENIFSEDGHKSESWHSMEGGLSKLIETKTGIVLTAFDSLPGEIRVIAVLNDGREIAGELELDFGHSAKTSNDAAKNESQRMNTATFAGLTLKQIKRIKLQHRPYQWVEFRNVELQPGPAVPPLPPDADKTIGTADAGLGSAAGTRDFDRKTVSFEKADISWIASLPQGEIELVAVSRHPSKGQSWWRPDGTPYAERQFDNSSGRFTVNNKNMEHYELVFRLPQGASLESRNSEPAGAWGGSGVPEADGRYLYGYRCALAAFPKSANTVNLHFAVASGDWTTIYEHEPIGSHSTQGRRVGDTQWTVSFTGAVENADGSTVVTVAHTPADRDTRVIAVDNEGQEYTVSRSEGSLIDNVGQLTATFQNLPLKRIKEFRFQARPYQLVEFRNVALHSGPAVPPLPTDADKAGGTGRQAAGTAPTKPGTGKASGTLASSKSNVPWGEWNAGWSVRLRLPKPLGPRTNCRSSPSICANGK